MSKSINVKELRASLPDVVRRVRAGERITVLYRSRPAFRIVPVEDADIPDGALEDDALFQAGPVGRSRDGRAAADHDELLYGS